MAKLVKPIFNNTLNKISQSEYKALAFCMLIGFAVRLIPELLAYPNPIGYDTTHYALKMQQELIISNWTQIFTTTWLLYAIIVPLQKIIQGDPFMILKFFAPLLFGLNVAGVYWFARKTLNWSFKMSLVAAIFFALQLASLRISWDLLRNTLGLGLLLFAFSYVKTVNSKRGFALFTGLSLLTVFAHEYAAVILLVTIIGLLGWKLIEHKSTCSFKPLLIGIIPALSVFMVGLYFKLYPVNFDTMPSNVMNAGDVVSARQSIFFVNYLQVQTSLDSYSNYWMLLLQVVLLFTVLFLPYILLVKKGYFRNGILTIWVLLALFGSFGCLIVPFFALQYWHRWMFMLVYPFTFYAIYGATKILKNSSLKLNTFFSLPISHKKVKAMILITMTLGAAYLMTPITMTYANKSVPNITGTQLYFSTDPSVPYQDVDDVVKAMSWLNSNINSSSYVILQFHLLNWGKMYLNDSITIVYYVNSLDLALNKVCALGYGDVYFVGWNQPIGWDIAYVSPDFFELQTFDRISIWEVY
ncbi:MAG: hypothetical protein NWF01_05915 [Candidatus Bathyarchaeota archaeon]|nr:hypothetical protein [Candidatus Bathyarchaeota archaeon]